MKRQINCLAAAVVVVVLSAGCAGSKPSLKAGDPVKLNKPTSIVQMVAHPDQYVGQVVRIEGTVSSVCKGSGCWVEVRSTEGATIMAKSADHSILVPTDCEGRRIVVQGTMTAIPQDPADSHGDHGHAEGAEEPHECPAPAYLVSTSGIELY